MQTFDPWVIGVIGAAGLLTALVPASVMLMSASVGLTKSFYNVLVPKASEKQQLIVSKLFIILIAFIALIFTITGGEALAILNIMSYSLLTQLAPALFFSFAKNNLINKYGAITGMLVIPLIPSMVAWTRTRILQPSACQTLRSQHLHHLRRSSRDHQATSRYR